MSSNGMVYDVDAMDMDDLATQLAQTTLEHQPKRDVDGSEYMGNHATYSGTMEMEMESNSAHSNRLVVSDPASKLNDSSTVEEAAELLLEFAYDEIKFALPFQNDHNKLFELCALMSDEILERCTGKSMGLPVFAPTSHPYYPYWLPDHPVNNQHIYVSFCAVKDVESRQLAPKQSKE